MPKVLKGVQIASKRLPKDSRVLWIPYLNFEIQRIDRSLSKNFWIDSYFLNKLSTVPRRAALIRKPSTNIADIDVGFEDVVLEPSIRNPEEIYGLLYEAYQYSLNVLKTSKPKPKRISRWGLFRRYVLPSRTSTELIEDKEVALARECIWAYEILKEALIIDESASWRKGIVRGGEIYWYPIVSHKARDGSTIFLDGGDKSLKIEMRYTRLIQVDEGVRKVFEDILKPIRTL